MPKKSVETAPFRQNGIAVVTQIFTDPSRMFLTRGILQAELTASGFPREIAGVLAPELIRDMQRKKADQVLIFSEVGAIQIASIKIPGTEQTIYYRRKLSPSERATIESAQGQTLPDVTGVTADEALERYNEYEQKRQSIQVNQVIQSRRKTVEGKQKEVEQKSPTLLMNCYSLKHLKQMFVT